MLRPFKQKFGRVAIVHASRRDQPRTHNTFKDHAAKSYSTFPCGDWSVLLPGTEIRSPPAGPLLHGDRVIRPKLGSLHSHSTWHRKDQQPSDLWANLAEVMNMIHKKLTLRTRV